MKVRTHSIPKDCLSFDYGKMHVSVSTHHNRIHVWIDNNGTCVLSLDITPEQFVSLLMRDTQP